MGIIDIFELVNKYSGAIAAFAAIGALIYARKAIKRTTEDNRKQILVGKFEEIYELVVLLSVEYGHLYDAYILFEKSLSTEIPEETRKAINENFRRAILKTNGKVEIEDLFTLTIRLNVLANAYLTGEIKFQIIGYSQLFEAIINVLKSRDLKVKEDEFPEILPTTEKVFELVNRMTARLVEVINLGSENKGYVEYRETVFKKQLGLRE
ncbi:hypothetical protein [Flavobacterium hibernum]|uniref:Uncharacterized protein n=1 Tax=Flavobacterium hibernum TaxID=37752 RepID=A0A0D0EZ72_9FLAO|nr:hypothetical protein [Flavobacterium hibernum]KIO50942.1 hypothetical protein IW18_20345 [Flavobacterium hibernum]OXA85182.1 hypothetical protein B0A73_17685 [Flavobacterium hibernum]STO19558.1 Uncharacterised protein [Flavobacterium hibernum]